MDLFSDLFLDSAGILVDLADLRSDFEEFRCHVLTLHATLRMQATFVGELLSRANISKMYDFRTVQWPLRDAIACIISSVIMRFNGLRNVQLSMPCSYSACNTAYVGNSC